MALYGKALANQVPRSVTENQARVMYGAMTDSLRNAYGELEQYDTTGIAQASGLDAGAVASARQYLDSTNDMLSKYYAHLTESDDQVSDQQYAELQASVSTSSVAVKTIDDLFNTSWGSELSDSIVSAAGTVSAAIANGVSKVAGSFLGGMWYLIVLGLAGLWAWHKWGHKLVT